MKVVSPHDSPLNETKNSHIKCLRIELTLILRVEEGVHNSLRFNGVTKVQIMAEHINLINLKTKTCGFLQVSFL